jgi:hypothetical protein
MPQDDECLQENDLKSLTMSIYRQRRKEYPALPKSREEVHNCMEVLELQTNKNEQFCLTNSKEHGIIILSFLAFGKTDRTALCIAT